MKTMGIRADFYVGYGEKEGGVMEDLAKKIEALRTIAGLTSLAGTLSEFFNELCVDATTRVVYLGHDVGVVEEGSMAGCYVCRRCGERP
jgi:hypothetical protein